MQAPESFEFFNQSKFNSGKKALETIPVELESMDARKPLVLTNKTVTKAGLGKVLVKALYDSEVIIGGLYDQVHPYASIDQVKDLAELFYERGCDSIVAFGSGSVMNVARGLNMLVSHKTDILQFAGADKVPSHLKPFIAVPFGSLSGFETANEAVIDNQKFHSRFLFPDVVILDERLTKLNDKSSVVSAAFAALACSIEACDHPYSNPISDSYAHAAIQFINENLPKAVKSPAHKKAGLALLNASAMAGAAFSNAPAGLVCTAGRIIAQDTGLPNGICMGVILPHALDYKIAKKEKFRGELLLALAGLDAYAATPEKEMAPKAIALVKQLSQRCSKVLPRTLRDFNIPPYKLKVFAKQAAEASPRVKFEDCVRVLEMAWQGK